jgi:hypothetical protein
MNRADWIAAASLDADHTPELNVNARIGIHSSSVTYRRHARGRASFHRIGNCIAYIDSEEADTEIGPELG